MEKIKLLAVLLLALIAYAILAKVSYMERGYFAVGGEMFVPIGIIAWGIYNIFKPEENETDHF